MTTPSGGPRAHCQVSIKDLGKRVVAVGSYRGELSAGRLRVNREERPRTALGPVHEEERFHERAFRRLAGAAAPDAALDGHERGMAVLGLRP